ncbi:MAG: alpha/beta hydrolase [Aeromicrobium sp.]
MDDATQALLDQVQSSGAPPVQELGPELARQMGAAFTPMFGPGPEMARTEDVAIDTADGSTIEARVHVPNGDVAQVVVYFHGGGWVTGHIDEFDTLGRQLADRTGSAVVLVNYRKAPENPYPTAANDATAAVQWVADHLGDIAGADVPLVVAGDSAGGNLAAVVSRRARDAAGPAIAAQVLIYPVTDHDFSSPSYVDPANDLLLTADSMAWFWDCYCPPERRDEPDVSPARAADLSGLPPALVLQAEHDVLRSEGERYAEALEVAGVPVVRQVVEGQMHGFFTMVNILPGAAEGLDFVAEHLAGVINQEVRA